MDTQTDEDRVLAVFAAADPLPLLAINVRHRVESGDKARIREILHGLNVRGILETTMSREGFRRGQPLWLLTPLGRAYAQADSALARASALGALRAQDEVHARHLLPHLAPGNTVDVIGFALLPDGRHRIASLGSPGTGVVSITAGDDHIEVPLRNVRLADTRPMPTHTNGQALR